MQLDYVPIQVLHWGVLAKILKPILLGHGILLAIIAFRLVLAPRPQKTHVARLGNLTWKRNQFCRGWLITGDTGSGKTSSGINQLAHQVFQNEPRWGGLCVDEKGVYWETLSAMAEHYGREKDLVHLQIRTDEADDKWQPPHRLISLATAAFHFPPMRNLL